MSRQQERGDLPPEVRIRMAEDDLDRVDQRFETADAALKHARGNVEIQVQATDRKHEVRADRIEQNVERLGTKFEQLENEIDEKVDGNRKVMVGVLISTLSVAIAIVAQVLIMRGGGS